eukprot:1108162-Amphidinium_carterae.1
METAGHNEDHPHPSAKTDLPGESDFSPPSSKRRAKYLGEWWIEWHQAVHNLPLPCCGAEVAAQLWLHFLSVPGSLRQWAKFTYQENITSPTAASRDGFPIHLPALTAEVHQRRVSLALGRAVTAPDQVARSCWQDVITIALNALHGGIDHRIPEVRPQHGLSTAGYDEFLKDIDYSILGLINSADFNLTGFDLPSLFRGSKIDGYTGELVQTPSQLTVLQVVPSLPPLGLAGSIEAVELAEGFLATALRDPAQ